MPIITPLKRASESVARAKLCLKHPGFQGSPVDALDILQNRFGDIDENGDNRISELEYYKAGSGENELALAIRYLINQGISFDFIETANNNDNYLDRFPEEPYYFEGGDDGKASSEDIRKAAQIVISTRVLNEIASKIGVNPTELTSEMLKDYFSESTDLEKVVINGNPIEKLDK